MPVDTIEVRHTTVLSLSLLFSDRPMSRGPCLSLCLSTTVLCLPDRPTTGVPCLSLCPSGRCKVAPLLCDSGGRRLRHLARILERHVGGGGISSSSIASDRTSVVSCHVVSCHVRPIDRRGASEAARPPQGVDGKYSA